MRWVSELKSGKGDKVSRAVLSLNERKMIISSKWSGFFLPQKKKFTSSVVELRGNTDTSLILAWEGEG